MTDWKLAANRIQCRMARPVPTAFYRAVERVSLALPGTARMSAPRPLTDARVQYDD